MLNFLQWATLWILYVSAISSLYLNICGLRTGPGKFFMGVVESPGKVLDFLSNSWEPCVCVSRRVGRRQRVRGWPVCVCWTSIIEDEASTSPSVRFTSTHSTPPTTPNEWTTNALWRPLTGTAMKHSVPDQVKLSFVIFDSSERQSAQMSKIIQITA